MRILGDVEVPVVVQSEVVWCVEVGWGVDPGADIHRDGRGQVLLATRGLAQVDLVHAVITGHGHEERLAAAAATSEST